MDPQHLLGRLEEFKQNTERRLDGIESKLDSLIKFKWQILGISAFITVVVSLTIEILRG